ncbi:MAG: spore cortex-lytic protein [Ruminococcaceae bacterium]|nr:spore cortex-lytic protein [Oscillospiraceae bacterium]
MPVYISETITVHLGAPDDTSAQNVTVPFIDYIKNVASSEIYPTWPESALRANIYAQISFALNRIFTEYYRARGYNFDITNSTATDQSFVYGRDIFENIEQIVDSIFDEYLRRQGFVEPLFAQYCDGVRVTCEGLSQWGSVSLAESGYTPYEILTNYYGSDIDIVRDTPILPFDESFPQVPLEIGSSGNDVTLLQLRLNRVSNNYPAIPKIYPVNGVFGVSTDEAVREFQEIFGLAVDGRVGKATWYQLLRIYGGVKRLSELQSEGITPGEISLKYPGSLSVGSTGDPVRILQYFINVIAQSNSAIPEVAEDGIFGEGTRNAVIAFQRTYGLPQTGVVEENTWNTIYNVYEGILETLPQYAVAEDVIPFPGRVLSLGVEGNGVNVLQQYLNEISAVYTEIPSVSVTDVYSSETEAAVRAFQQLFGYPVNGIVGVIVWDAIADLVSDIRNGSTRREGQYPGYNVGGGNI